MKTEDIKKKLKTKRKVAGPIPVKDFLSSSSTLINLGCTGRPQCGFAKGYYYHFAGVSDSGKTWVSLAVFAEASINPGFDDYRFIYDAPEQGALMNLEEFFGPSVAERLEAPRPDGSSSDTIEDFYYNVDDALAAGKPFIYVLDSMDSLTSNEERNKFAEQKKASRKGKEVSGTYAMGKAKMNASGIRQMIGKLKKSKSMLMVISQEKAQIGSMVGGKTTSGGESLKFYATLQIWFAMKKKLMKTVRGSKIQQGIISKVRIKKNRVKGRDRSVEIPIYNSFGIDDVGSCVDYLTRTKHWKTNAGIITADEFDFKGKREALIKEIESTDSEVMLQNIVALVWDEIESAAAIRRKSRYH